MRPGRALREFLRLYPESISRSMRIGLICAAASSLLDFASLLLLLPVFTDLTSNSSTKTFSTPLSSVIHLSVQTYIVLAMIFMITRSISTYVLRAWWMKRIAYGDVSLSNRLVSAYVYAPYEFHLSSNSAQLMSKAVSNVNTATFSGLGGLLTLATDGTTVASLTAALLVASPLAGLAVCGYLALIGTIFTYFSRRSTGKYSRQYSSEVSHVYHRTATVLRGVRELTVANAQEAVLSSIRESRASMTAAQRRLALLTDLPRMTLETALYGAVLATLLIVVTSANPSNALPVVALYVVAGLRVLPAVSRALGTVTQIRSGTEIGREVAGELARLESGAHRSDPGTPLPAGGALELGDVSFGYRHGPLVFDRLSLTVPKGRFIAIVGPSGGGKSTLLNLLLGLLEPRTGSVRYAGTPIGLANPAWFAQVGYLPQESYMLDDSILANVTLGQQNVDHDRTWQALRRAGLAEHVAGLAEGLNTQVGENGSRLSVGQRQRLGLARALYRKPSVLLLDEPTAALDQHTERHVIDSIESLRGEITIIMVSHRKQPIRGADEVYELRDGRLVRDLVSTVERK